MVARSVPTVISVVVLLVCTSLAGCLSDEGRVDTREVEFYEPDIFSTRVNGTKFWNIELRVSNATFENLENPDWSDVSISVKSPDGTESTGRMPAKPLPTSFPEDPGAYYVPRGAVYFPEDVDDINVGDSLYIIGLDERFIGGTVRMMWKDETVSIMDLPDDFTPKADITFQDPATSVATFPSTVAWTFDLLVDAVGPNSTELLWYTLQLGIQDPDGNVLLGPRPLLEDPGTPGYDDDSDGTVSVEFWYVEMVVEDWPRRPHTMDEGDGLRITGLSRAYEGDVIVLFKGEDPVWSSMPITYLAFDPVDIVLGNATIKTLLFNNQSRLYWEAIIPVDETPDGEPIWWSNITIDVKDSELDSLSSDWPVYRDKGLSCSSLEAFFDDGAFDDGNVTAGDVLRLTGLDLGYRGAQVELILQGFTAGVQKLPIGFPMDIVYVGVWRTYIDNRTSGDDVLWDLTINISRVYPYNIDIPWDEITMRIVNQSSGKVLLALTAPDLYEGTKGEGPEVLYDEASPSDGIVSHFDRIYLFGLDESLEGLWLELYLGSEHVDDIRLPSPFDRSKLGPVTMNLASPSVDIMIINDTYYYRAVLNINKITPKEAEVLWDDLRIEIIAYDGNVLVPKSPINEDIWGSPRYDEDDTDGIDVELWYVETSTGDIRAGAGDAFILSGLTTAFESATVYIYMFGNRVATAVLPTNFS
jgi:hypothetical protein